MVIYTNWGLIGGMNISFQYRFSLVKPNEDVQMTQSRLNTADLIDR